jgi:uncharacterized membrane protein YeaQ/YmgE (transglycosylase-associated protein family)
VQLAYDARVLILGLIVFGLIAGAIAQLILGQSGWKINWTMALVSGLIGSFVGGLLLSLLTGNGLSLRPSGIIGSIVGALLVTIGYQWWQKRSAGSSKAA